MAARVCVAGWWGGPSKCERCASLPCPARSAKGRCCCRCCLSNDVRAAAAMPPPTQISILSGTLARLDRDAPHYSRKVGLGRVLGGGGGAG